MRYLVAVFSLLAGCAAQEQLVWTKTGVGNVGYAEAAQACEYDAQRVFNADIGSPLRARYMGQQTYTACMKSKGWTEQPVASARPAPEPYTIYRSPVEPTPQAAPAVAPAPASASRNPIECAGAICDYR